MEDWETDNLKSNGPIIEAKFPNKYKDLVFKDDDTGLVYRVESRNMDMEFHRQKGNRGWHLICETNGG